MNEKIERALKLRKAWERVSEDVRERDDINGSFLVGAAATKWLEAEAELTIPEYIEYMNIWREGIA